MKRIPSFGLVAAAVFLALAGCHSSSQPPLLHGEHFVPDDQPHAVNNVAAAQSASGARADATLHAFHFNDTALNSTGREKLELMLEDEEAAQPLVIYLDLPTHTEMGPVHQAVADYLKARGLSENQIKLIDGPNPRTLHPSTDALAGLTALQQPQTNGAPSAATANQQQSAGGYGPSATPTDNMNH